VITDDEWPVARLIPVSSASGVEAQERRLASALLAVMSAVPEFGLTRLRPLGAPSGPIQTFIEVPFKLSDGRSLRPDGVVAVTRAGRTWTALFEAKVAANRLDPNQMNAYLDLARETDSDAVVTISNEYVSSSTEYPISIDKRRLKRTTLRHWSWTDVLTVATVQKEHRGVKDPDQAYILGELIRYLSDPRSGAVDFEGMGSGWTTVRDGARVGTLRRNDENVAAVAKRWDDLMRYVALSLTTSLGREVRQVLPPAERTATARRHALTDSLASHGVLEGELQVPDAAGTLVLRADLRTRQVIASTTVDAPRDATSRGRVSWLIRQLQTAPGDLTVEARIARTSSSLAEPLAIAREDPARLYPEQGRDIRSFDVSAASRMGEKRDNSRGSFAESVVSAAESFYEQVLQRLRAWKAQPPRLRKPPEVDETTEEVVAELVGVDQGSIGDLEQADEGITPDPATVREYVEEAAGAGPVSAVDAEGDAARRLLP
jgi:hypothetical protein